MRFRALFAIAILVVLSAMPSVVNAFSISPAILELRGARGETVQTKISIFNTENREKTYYLRTLSFSAKSGQEGMPEFVSADVSASELANWISFSSRSVLIPAHVNREVPFFVAIPSDIPSGGYQAAILVSDAPSEAVASSGATLQASIASLIFLTVEGQNSAIADLMDFTSSKQGRLALSAAGSFSYRIQNQGNVYIQPEGTVVIKDIFGRVLSVTNANPARGRVLAGTTRKFEGGFGAEGNRMWTLGPISAELRLSYGGDKILREKIRFWMISPGFFAVIVLLIGLEIVRRKWMENKRKPKARRRLPAHERPEGDSRGLGES